MPIVASQVRAGGGVLAIPDDDRRLDFRALDGSDVIEWNTDDYIARKGLTGIDVPPRTLVRQRIPGLPGSRLVEVRDEEREVFLPLWTKALDRDYRTSLAQLARVRRFLDYRTVDYVAEEGTFDLVAFADGSERALRCTYSAGMEGDYATGVDASQWRMFGLSLLACDPYWHGLEWTTPAVKLPTTTPFLSESPAYSGLGRIALSPSRALGLDMPIDVGGDVPSPATLAGVGPWSSARITSPQGLDVTIGAVAAGQVMYLNAGRQKVLELDGVRRWDLLGDAPQWEPLPPGTASITVAVAGATSATEMRVFGTELWETGW